MQGYLPRFLQGRLPELLDAFPAVAILGPRQCGKTTLVRETVARRPEAVYLDLERPSDRQKLGDPELFFRLHQEEEGPSIYVLDEIQRVPELFPVLRGVIDETGRNGQFLIVGSASRDLIRQSSESLAGRIVFFHLTPFLASEVDVGDDLALGRYWLRGGFPRSYLAPNDRASRLWRESFVRTFLERDIPQLGFNIPADTLRRLWRMLAHHHGQLLNSSKLGGALGFSHTTTRSHLELLSQTFMVRLLEPFEANVKKRLVKSPKVYIRDSGLLHALLEIDDREELLGHPCLGESWEGLVIENAIATLPEWRPSFYRTSAGAELDLVLSRGRRRIAVECKASSAPTVRRGFWSSLEDLDIDTAYVVAPVEESFPLRENIWVLPLGTFLERLLEDAGADSA